MLLKMVAMEEMLEMSLVKLKKHVELMKKMIKMMIKMIKMQCHVMVLFLFEFGLLVVVFVEMLP